MSDPAKPFASGMWCGGMRIRCLYNLAQYLEGWVIKFVLLQDRLERNVLTVMPQLAVGQVENGAVGDSCPIRICWQEHEFGGFVDESCYEPRTSDSINLYFFSRNPLHRSSPSSTRFRDRINPNCCRLRSLLSNSLEPKMPAPETDPSYLFPWGLARCSRLGCRARIESSWPVRERCLDPKNVQRCIDYARPTCDCGSIRCRHLLLGGL